jgi:hypothetical protein
MSRGVTHHVHAYHLAVFSRWQELTPSESLKLNMHSQPQTPLPIFVKFYKVRVSTEAVWFMGILGGVNAEPTLTLRLRFPRICFMITSRSFRMMPQFQDAPTQLSALTCAPLGGVVNGGAAVH